MKRVFLILLLACALIVAMWVSRAQLSEIAISSFMRGAGFSRVSLDIRQLDPDQSHISRLEFSIVNETGLLQLEAQDIRLSYSPGQLMDGGIDSITISKIILHHQGPGSAQAVTPDIPAALDMPKILLAIRQALREYVIFNTVSAEHITLNGDAFRVVAGKPLGFKITNEGAGLYATLSLLKHSAPDQLDDVRRDIVARQSGDSLTVELRSSAAMEPVAAGFEFNISDSVVMGSYQVNPGQLQHWLRPLTSINGMGAIAAVKGTLSINAESADYIVTTVTANCESMVFAPYTAKNVAGKLILRNPTSNPMQQTELQTGSYINVSNFSNGVFSLANSRIAMAGALTIADDSWDYKGAISSGLLVARYESQSVRLKNIAVDIKLDPESLELNGVFSPAKLPGKFAFVVDNSFSKKKGRLTVRPVEPIDINAGDSKLSQLLTPWPYPFDLLAGRLNLASDTVWSHDDLRLTTKIRLEGAGGVLAKEVIFSGLSFDHELEFLPVLHSLNPGKINLMQLDGGVTVSNVVASLALEPSPSGAQPQLVIKGLHGDILGGHFSSDVIAYDLNKSTNRFNIKVSNVDLAEVVKTQQLEDIVVTGSVDGSLPVEINEQGVSIENGALLNNIRVGTIQYNPASGTEQLKQNPLTGTVLDTLRDFRYSHLAAGVNYTPEGLLTVNLQLKGTSPALDTDRPVHLNINTEQNLISLLKSLRFGQGISDTIDKKVRDQYEKSNSNN